MTADDLMALPEDEWRYELVHGRLVRMSPTGFGHTEVANRLHFALYGFVKDRGLGTVTMPDTGFLVSAPGEPDTVLAPDMAFVPADRVPTQDSPDWMKFLRPAPDLVVEIASPSQYRPEMAAKVRLWLDAGARIVWVIWPASRQVDVWHADPGSQVRTLQGSDVLDGEDVLPGFTFPVAGLWQ
jgi:Uma2 family endonuclease